MVTLFRFHASRTAIATNGADSDSLSELVGRVDRIETAARAELQSVMRG